MYALFVIYLPELISSVEDVSQISRSKDFSIDTPISKSGVIGWGSLLLAFYKYPMEPFTFCMLFLFYTNEDRGVILSQCLPPVFRVHIWEDSGISHLLI